LHLIAWRFGVELLLFERLCFVAAKPTSQSPNVAVPSCDPLKSSARLQKSPVGRRERRMHVMQKNLDAERIFQMRCDPDAARINIAPMVQRHVCHNARGLYQVRHARQHIVQGSFRYDFVGCR
jgi:hypothetical protein